MTHDSSTWTFSTHGLIEKARDARREAVAKEQHALRVMQSADTTFATAITARLVPDRGTNLDIIRRVVP